MKVPATHRLSELEVKLLNALQNFVMPLEYERLSRRERTPFKPAVRATPAELKRIRLLLRKRTPEAK